MQCATILTHILIRFCFLIKDIYELKPENPFKLELDLLSISETPINITLVKGKQLKIEAYIKFQD